MQDRFVVSLAEVGRGDLEMAGGKGANLGELVRAGMAVPPGFVVTTTAYERFVAANGLAEAIAAGLHDTTGDGAAIREAFVEGAVPEEIAAEIVAAYEEMGCGAVAVRSSATAEDLPQAAFAGQQESYLNVQGDSALLEATRRCWASLWTERAIAYRQRQGMGEEAVALAVVVQRMVRAGGAELVAGVMFTANPVTGEREETVIDASAGLGEALVSGVVTPDSYVLRRQRGQWRVSQQRAGRREALVRALPGGGTEQVRGVDVEEWPVLPEEVLQRLAALGANIEAHFGAPQDVEWAWDGQALSILQARPMTALPEPLGRVSRPARLLSGIFAEMMPGRPYPLEATTWGPGMMWSLFIAPFMGLLGLKALPIEALLPEEDGVVTTFRARTPVRPTPGILLAPLRLLLRARRYDPKKWRGDALLSEALAQTRTLNELELETLSWQQLVDTIRHALAVPRMIFELRFRYLPRGLLGAALTRLLLTLGRRSELFGMLLFTGVETKTLEANQALEALAAQVRADAVLSELFAHHEAEALWVALEGQAQGRVFLKDLHTFLDEFGHREAGGTMLFSQETWRDAPEVVLGALKGMATQAAQPYRGTEQFEAARKKALTSLLLRLPGVRRVFERALKQAGTFVQVREDTRFYATLVMPVLRHTALEMGQRLQEAGVLAEAQDVYHLRMEELEEAGAQWPPKAETKQALQHLVQRRKDKRAALEKKPLIDPRLYRRRARGEGLGSAVLVEGTPGSPGVAQGAVCVVTDGMAFGKLRPGDVLVAPYTNPAWTPLFQQAAAVVVDTGSAASHAAITAREYGIPAVMATGDGTSRLKDGQVVRVDGGMGVVVAVGD